MCDYFCLGGHPGGVRWSRLPRRSCARLRLNEEVLDIVRHFFEADKPTAVLCHAPQTPTVVGVLDGRPCTSSPGLAPDIEAAGGEWVDEVTVDRNLVTRWVYDDHPDWLREFVEILGTEIEHGLRSRPTEPARGSPTWVLLLCRRWSRIDEKRLFTLYSSPSTMDLTGLGATF